MGEETVSIRLIYANGTSTQELTVPLATPVRDVKRTILEKHWPETMPGVQSVERLRLFAGGQELGGKDAEDQKTLWDAKIAVSASHPTPVHVQPMLRAAAPAQPEREATKSSQTQCLCAVL